MNTTSIGVAGVFLRAAAVCAALGVAGAACGQSMSVSATSPTKHAVHVSRSSTVSITFDRAVDPATFTASNFKVFGKASGPALGTLAYSNGNQTVTFTKATPFIAGELVQVIMSRNLRGADGVSLRSAGYTFEFVIAGRGTGHVFKQKASVSNRDATGAQTRIYGGLACDLNRDGWSDMTTINEVSSDLRVFLNPANGNVFGPTMVTPYVPIPDESSPNDVADFDGDGKIDVVTSSYSQGQIAVAFGNGDGTFRLPATVINVGTQPRGFGILDADGDGDLDITVANAVSYNVSIILNNGNGTFAPVVNMPVGGGPYGMTATDANNDGILDLVVGGRDDRNIRVLRGNGDGTFTQISSRQLGGNNWVVVCGDVNGDGKIDASTANSGSNNGSILLGNGDGTFQAPTIQPTGGHTVSTDLADLDGDGDLDWIISSFGAGRWYVYLNNGAGVFSPLQEVVAPANPSCAVPCDVDNDGDIDMVLTDEIADVLVVLVSVCPADYDLSNTVTLDDIFAFLGGWFAQSPRADFDNNSAVTIDDIFGFLNAWFGSCV